MKNLDHYNEQACTITLHVLSEIAATGSSALWPADREIPREEADKLASRYTNEHPLNQNIPSIHLKTE